MPVTPCSRGAAGQAPGLVALLRTPSWGGWLPAEVAAEDVILVDTVPNLQQELFTMSHTWGRLVSRYAVVAGRGTGLALGFTPDLTVEAFLIGAAWENVRALRQRLYGDEHLSDA